MEDGGYLPEGMVRGDQAMSVMLPGRTYGK